MCAATHEMRVGELSLVVGFGEGGGVAENGWELVAVAVGMVAEVRDVGWARDRGWELG